MQIAHCGIKNNLEILEIGQNNNLIIAVKFHQNT
jgi:hypothetical protein